MRINCLRISALLLVICLGSCSIFQNSHQRSTEVTTIDSVSMSKIIEAINNNKEANQENEGLDKRTYEAASTKFWDLIHTDLSVEFDYAKAQLTGLATITLTPHAYEQDSVVLDAKGMEIIEISDGDSRGWNHLKYHYNQKELIVFLRLHTLVGETRKITIRYIAKPNEIIVKGSDAITSDKGLYFINNEGKDGGKPRQIWTQGETENNSCWFPTIDKPNQKMTQYIRIIVQDSNDISLSNGIFVGREKNKNGTYTDSWRQDIPAAPYLTMMAIGNFAIEHDTWRYKDVNYYVEPKFKPYAKLIFGKTPAMMEFFSSRLGVNFVWEKYSQMVVRDFVSGSMENASATIHGEFLQFDSRQYLDDNKEDYISHELFHQWFGDLVTCESWSNLALNESFATYGEYLWIEYSRGRMEADKHLSDNKNRYLQEASFKQEPLIRFHYEDKDDMFDRHSYQKGGCILHMLRSYLGDDVFFKGLQHYLEINKFKSVEVHDLRLALEETSGEDLNWFFNQWFLRAGHPKVGITQKYNIETKSLQLNIDFIKTNESNPQKFILPINVDFYFKDSVHREKIVIKEWSNRWNFSFNDQPLLVNVDAERITLWEIVYPKTKEELIYQILNAPLYFDKKEAIVQLLEQDEMTVNDKKILIEYCLSHDYWGVKELTIEIMDFMKAKDLDPYFNKISELVLNQKTSSLRVSFLQILDKMSNTHDILPLLRACTNDSSYMVMANALELLSVKDIGSALKICQANEYVENNQVINTISSIYCTDTSANHVAYFLKSIESARGYEKNIRLREIETYLRKTTADIAYQTILQLVKQRIKLTDEYSNELLPDTKNYFATKRIILADEMSRTRYTEDGYKAATQLLELYDKILDLLK